MFKTIKIVVGMTLLVSLSVPATGFARETPNCGDDKVKTWVIEKVTGMIKDVIHSENVRRALSNHMILDLPGLKNDKTPENIEFMKFFGKEENLVVRDSLISALLGNKKNTKLEIDNAKVAYNILQEYKNERVVAQVLQEIDQADVANQENLVFSLSAIRTKAKDDSIKKVFCITNADSELGTMKDIEYTAQATEDGLLYMELKE